MSVGIPYARAEYDDKRGIVVRVCPVCGARIDEPADAVGEPHSGNPYGEHYAAEHDTDQPATPAAAPTS